MIKFHKHWLAVNGQRVPVFYHTGPWIAGVDPSTIKVWPKRYRPFPREVWEAFSCENNSNLMTDYFEKDCLRVTNKHPRYAEILAAARK